MRTESATLRQAEACWQALLGLAEQVREHRTLPERIGLALGADPQVAWDAPATAEVQVLTRQNGEPLSTKGAVLRLRNRCEAEWVQVGTLQGEAQRLLQQYLPYCFLSQWAHEQRRAIAVSHFAQTLDGKIATDQGDSKWIGNPENLLHAHRMRALCEGILIGGQTLLRDQPQLTVRHVSGRNPRRIVLTSSRPDLTPLLQSCSDPVMVLGLDESDTPPHLCLPRRQQGRIDGRDVLTCLYEQGIYTVYVEGGAQTTSNFLADGAIDLLQLHFSPLVFGSGIGALRLPKIDWVKEAISFEPFVFQPVGDSVMFVGVPHLAD